MPPIRRQQGGRPINCETQPGADRRPQGEDDGGFAAIELSDERIVQRMGDDAEKKDKLALADSEGKNGVYIAAEDHPDRAERRQR